LLIVLAFSLATAAFKRQFRFWALSLVITSVVATQFYSVVIASRMGMNQYGGVPTGDTNNFFLGLGRTFLRGIGSLQRDLSDLLAALLPVLDSYRYQIEWVPAAGGALVLVCTMLVILGALYPQGKFSFIGAVFLLTCSLLFARMREDGLYSLRYILPYIPLVLLFLLQGIETAKIRLFCLKSLSVVENDLRVREWRLNVDRIFGLGLLFLAFLLIPQSLRNPNFMEDRFRSEGLSSAVEILSEEVLAHESEVQIGFFKPRTLQLLLEENDIRVRVSYSGALYLVEDLCLDGGFILVHKSWGKGQLEITENYLNDPISGQCAVLWEGDEYLILKG